MSHGTGRRGSATGFVCRVHAALVRARRCPAASRPLNQSGGAASEDGGERGAKEVGGRGGRSHLLLGLDGISRSHVVAGDVAFLPGVDRASLPPVAFTAGTHKHTQITAAPTTKGIHRIKTPSRTELTDFIDPKLRRCRSTKKTIQPGDKERNRECSDLMCQVEPHTVSAQGQDGERNKSRVESVQTCSKHLKARLHTSQGKI